jgi:hypothetical protein
VNLGGKRRIIFWAWGAAAKGSAGTNPPQELEDVSNLTLISLTDFINYRKIATCSYLNG